VILGAAREQRTPGDTRAIEYKNDSDKWHTKTVFGSDQP
jgi:hypothetical protein